MTVVVGVLGFNDGWEEASAIAAVNNSLRGKLSNFHYWVGGQVKTPGFGDSLELGQIVHLLLVVSGKYDASALIQGFESCANSLGLEESRVVKMAVSMSYLSGSNNICLTDFDSMVVSFCDDLYDYLNISASNKRILGALANRGAHVGIGAPLSLSDSLCVMCGDHESAWSFIEERLRKNGDLFMIPGKVGIRACLDRGISLGCAPGTVQILSVDGSYEPRRLLEGGVNQRVATNSSDGMASIPKTRYGLIISASCDAREVIQVIGSLESQIKDPCELVVFGPRRSCLGPGWEPCANPVEKLSESTEVFDQIVIHHSLGIQRIQDVPKSLLISLLSKGVPRIRMMDEYFAVRDMPNDVKARDPEILFVFPDRIAPAERAFQVRGLDLAITLVRSSMSTVLLAYNRSMGKIKSNDLENLRSIWRDVETPRLVPGMEKPHGESGHGLRARVEQVSLDNALPIVDLLTRYPSIKTVVFTCAYFGEVKKSVQKLVGRKIDFACDLHDVFFQIARDSDALSEVQLSESESYECRMVSQFDKLVFISDSDRDAVESAAQRHSINLPESFVESGSFDHVRFKCPPPVFENVLKLGYIGSGNVHNKNALDLIVSQWIPKIRSRGTKVHLSIAGAISRAEVAERYAREFPREVSLLGRVGDLSKFYSEQHFMLGPVCVQGGLNFKNVEAIVCGRKVFTNDLGLRCLRGLNGAMIFDPDVFDDVEKLIRSARLESQTLAMDAERRFSGDNAYAGFVKSIRETQAVAGA